MVNIRNVEREIKGLQLLFIELPKFKKTLTGLDPALVGWLRYLQETGKASEHPEDLSVLGSEMQQALHLAEAAAYSRAEMEAYYRYWDGVSTAKTLISGTLAEGITMGIARGRAEGIVEGRKEGLQEGRNEGIQIGMNQALEKLIARGISLEEARSMLGIETA
jgi:flagellar biosynthesis/type III secretory pathway protein FliH